MPSTIAMRKCSKMVFVPPRFDVYREVFNQIYVIFKGYTPLVEPRSSLSLSLSLSRSLSLSLSR